MKFIFNHNNINVFDLEKSLTFYKENLGLTEVRRINADDGSFILVFLSDGTTSHNLELTWLKNRETPYNLGDNEFHLAFHVNNFEEAYSLHKKNNCVCYENRDMGIYFISDPDGYWIEIIPSKL